MLKLMLKPGAVLLAGTLIVVSLPKTKLFSFREDCTGVTCQVWKKFSVVRQETQEGPKLTNILWHQSFTMARRFSSVGRTPSAEITWHKYSTEGTMNTHFDYLSLKRDC